MPEHILVAMDYSEQAKKALRQALSDFPDAEVTVLHVIDFRTSDRSPGGWGSSPDTWDDWLEGARAHADELFATARDIAAEYGREITTSTAVGQDDRSIIEYVGDHDVDYVYVGSRGRRGVARVLLGSVAETVARRSPVPVMIVR